MGAFNQEINNLPPCLEKLKLSDRFNQRVDNLPQSLKYLSFGKDFNQSVDNLPQNLESLIFADSFSQPMDKLPKTLVYLIIGNLGVFDYRTLPLKPLKCKIVNNIYIYISWFTFHITQKNVCFRDWYTS